MAHRNVYDHFLSTGAECALIVEDDVTLAPDFKMLVSKVSKLPNFPEEYDALQLESCGKGGWFPRKYNQSDKTDLAAAPSNHSGSSESSFIAPDGLSGTVDPKN